MTTSTYTVSGMTCGHCVNAVKEELGGVSAVDVDLVAGGDSTVRVQHEGPLDREQVVAAVAEAGDYTVA